MSRSRDVGTKAETAVVAYLRDHGWPGAERRALHGVADRGDVVGTPGVVWEIKSGAKAETAGDSRIADWLTETEQERQAARADIGVLVTKRSAYGPSRAASWWAHLHLGALRRLLDDGRESLAPAYPAWHGEMPAPMRMHLSTAVSLLRAAGYGDPPGEGAGVEED